MANPDESPPSSRFQPMAYLRTPSRSRRVLIWLCGLALLGAAILVVLPIGAARYLQGWLQDNGAASAVVEDVDINVFTGVVRLTGLQASGGPRERLNVGVAELNLRWWPLVSQRIYVQALRLSDARIDVVAEAGQPLRIGAITVPAGDDDSEVEVAAGGASQWGFGSELVRLANVSLTYKDPVFDTQVDLRELRVGSQYTWEAGRSTELVLDVLIDGSPLLLNSDVVPWADERRLSGALSLKRLNLTDYRQALQQLAGLSEPSGSISLDFRLSAAYAADGGLELRIAGPLEVTDAGFSLGRDTIANQSLKWDGEVRVRLPASENQPLLSVEGGLQIAGARAALGELALVAELGSLDWSGTVGLSPPATEGLPPKVTLRSKLGGRGLRLSHTDLAFALASLESLELTGIEIDAVDRGLVKQLRLQDLRLLADTADGDGQRPDTLRLRQLDINDFGFNPGDGISAASVLLSDPEISLIRDAQGDFERVTAVTAAFAGAEDGVASAEDAVASVIAEQGDGPAAPAETAQPPPAAPARLRIADFQLRSGALLSFEDRSVNPPASFKLAATELLITGLDSSSEEPMQVSLTTGDASLALVASGTVNAFAQPPSADLVIDLSGLELPKISPYLPGYNIERGRFATDSKVTIKGDALDVSNALVIEKLKLSGKVADGTDALAQGMAMPLDVALDLLRDGDDRIKLELPVSGSLSDPQFDTGDIVKIAMQKALQNAALSYVKNALQPLGTLLMVSNLASKAARPRFDPIAMSAGDASLSADSRAYLAKLGDMLNERPGLQLTICSVAAPADREALTSAAVAAAENSANEAAAEVASQSPTTDADAAVAAEQPVAPAVTDAQLLQLAAARTEAVIGFLADAQKVARDRLFACRDTIEAADSSSPRVEITL